MSSKSRSSRSRRAITLTAAFAAAAVALSGCSNLGPAASTETSGSSTVVEVVPALSTQMSYDTSYAITTSYYSTFDMLNAGLIRKAYVDGDQAGTQVQDQYNFEGLLAESYDVSEDGLVYTFNLRDGVMSEHGNELTADDVVWSFQRKFGATTSILPYIGKPGLTSADQFTAIDENTVQLTLTNAAYGFTVLSILAGASGSIYDATFLQENVADDDLWATAFSSGRFDFGFGPYRVESVDAASEMVFVANPDYALGEPEITKVIQRVVPDAGNRAQALKSGDADIALGLSPSDQKELAEDENVLVPTKSRNGYLMLSLNTTLAPFDDLAVRKAFALAIDYDQIVDGVFQGRAEKNNAMLPADAPGHDGEGLPDWEYDPAAATAALEDAGYTDLIPVTLSVASEDKTLVDSAVAIKSAAADAGFDVTVDSVPATQLQEKASTGQTQLVLSKSESVTLSPPYMLGLLTTPGSSSNYARWSDQTFQDLVTAGSAFADPLSDEAGVAWNAAESYWLAEQVPNIFIGQVSEDSAVSSSLDGWTWRTDHAVDVSAMTLAD
ncbi:ABC transporter substrate-binding protein [Cryobacterium sp. SO2]|uniref:ABC transporter substrate-binding protein n=1 Tax=Cryobacterium sp. SO2 TaxID=1897060 RepID=UPI00223CE2DE|nr:ABC transporter substrate-binding protein [Cryobacterium sp. SO2]WEO77240.1 ABC transporter substrate-binding protein [Cryobacterium sp. SO2]